MSAHGLTCAVCELITQLDLDYERSARRRVDHGVILHQVRIKLLYQSVLDGNSPLRITDHALPISKPFIEADEKRLHLLDGLLAVRK